MRIDKDHCDRLDPGVEEGAGGRTDIVVLEPPIYRAVRGYPLADSKPELTAHEWGRRLPQQAV
jgi:hypothetical protein